MARRARERAKQSVKRQKCTENHKFALCAPLRGVFLHEDFRVIIRPRTATIRLVRGGNGGVRWLPRLARTVIGDQERGGVERRRRCGAEDHHGIVRGREQIAARAHRGWATPSLPAVHRMRPGARLNLPDQPPDDRASHTATLVSEIGRGRINVCRADGGISRQLGASTVRSWGEPRAWQYTYRSRVHPRRLPLSGPIVERHAVPRVMARASSVSRFA
jgi:hypothetical protein